VIRGHGGNIYDLAKRLGCSPGAIIDMSSNINPLGPPEGLIGFLEANLERIGVLPEVDAAQAVAAVADNWKVHPDRILAGSGTTQFIYTLPLAFQTRHALILGPTYADYADACRMHRVPVTFVFSDDAHGFDPDLYAVARCLEHGIDTVFICNANNPTGGMIPAGPLADLIRSYPRIRFVIDESYLPFADRGEEQSMIPKHLPNAVVLYSMSKIFRIPGLRIGFFISSEANVARQQRYALPWSVNSLSQAAVCYLMDHRVAVDAFVLRTRQFLSEQKRIVMDRFAHAPQVGFYPSTTSFLLGRLKENLTAEQVCASVAKHRILIRNCANFEGLSNRFIRVSLKDADCNRTLMQALSEIDPGRRASEP